MCGQLQGFGRLLLRKVYVKEGMQGLLVGFIVVERYCVLAQCPAILPPLPVQSHGTPFPMRGLFDLR